MDWGGRNAGGRRGVTTATSHAEERSVQGVIFEGDSTTCSTPKNLREGGGRERGRGGGQGEGRGVRRVFTCCMRSVTCTHINHIRNSFQEFDELSMTVLSGNEGLAKPHLVQWSDLTDRHVCVGRGEEKLSHLTSKQPCLGQSESPTWSTTCDL